MSQLRSTQRSARIRIGCEFFLCIFLALASSTGRADQYSRWLFKGAIHQAGAVKWDGEMELYLKLDPESDFPQALEGVITWPTLGMARTAISGTLSEKGELRFTETKCLSGACDKVVLGGEYVAKIDKSTKRVKGQAAGPFGLSAQFELNRTE